MTLAGSGLALSQNVAPARPVTEPEAAGSPAVAPARPVEIGPDGQPIQPAAPAEAFLQADPANDLLRFGEELLNRGEFSLAMNRFEEFLRAHPGHPNSRKALYQMGECLRRLDRPEDAEQVFSVLVDRYKNGELVDMAAYRAAALAYNRRDYRTAIPYFRICKTQTQDPKLKLDATFRAARALQLGGEPRLAAPFFREVLQTPEPNAFREPSMLALARQSLDDGQKDEALKFFLELSGSARDAAVRAESLVRAALIETDLKQNESAERHFAEVFDLPGAEAWKPVAQFGLIRSRYERKDYKGVVEAYDKGVFQLSDEMRAQMFLMTGNAYQRLERLPEAIKVYGILENFYQGKPEGQEAGYRRLECLYRSQDANLPAFVDYYVDTEKKAGRDHAFIDRALLLKAETLFARNEPVPAADTYAAIRLERLPESQRATATYKHGWAESEAGRRPKAIDALTRFLVSAPNDPRLPLALARRGEMFSLNGEVARAAQDFLTIIEKYPNSEATEYAYQQAANLSADKNDVHGMIRLYEGLLAKYPNSKAAPDAHYALGRGYYQLKEYAKSADHLRKARDADPKNYGRAAGSRLVLACYALRDAVALRTELDLFLKEAKPSELPPQVPAWLGVRLYEDGDPSAAAKYLSMAANDQDPKATQPIIWKFLAKSRLDAGLFADAVKASDHYLATVEQAASKASGLLDKARAQYGLKDYDAADATAMAGQSSVRQGKTNAWLALLRGDIAAARERWEEAIKFYIVPSETMVDPEITPLALYKLAAALQKSGDREEAKKYRAQLEKQFPAFTPPAPNAYLKADREEKEAPASLPQDLPSDSNALPPISAPTPPAQPAPAQPAQPAVVDPTAASTPVVPGTRPTAVVPVPVVVPDNAEVEASVPAGTVPDVTEAPPEP